MAAHEDRVKGPNLGAHDAACDQVVYRYSRRRRGRAWREWALNHFGVAGPCGRRGGPLGHAGRVSLVLPQQLNGVLPTPPLRAWC